MGSFFRAAPGPLDLGTGIPSRGGSIFHNTETGRADLQIPVGMAPLCASSVSKSPSVFRSLSIILSVSLYLGQLLVSVNLM